MPWRNLLTEETLTIPWGPLTTEQKETRILLPGERTVVIRRNEETLTIEADDTASAAEEIISRRFITGKQTELKLDPALPELPVVIKPTEELSILPGQRLETLLPIPLLLSVTTGSHSSRTTLWEESVIPLSQSFFGAPDSGELAYSLESSLVRREDALERSSDYAYCPLTIANRSDQILHFERMILRVPYLSLYYSSDGIYTSPVQISFKGSEQTSQVSIKKRPMEVDPPMKPAATPRTKEEKSVLKKSFFFLKTLYNG